MHYAAMLYIVNKHYFEHYLIWLLHILYHPIKLYITINDIYKSIRTIAFILQPDFVIFISVWSVIV